MTPQRLSLPAAALLTLAALPAAAQQPAPSPAPTQLDRIEAKLDELLRRLPQPGQPAANGPAAAPEPPTPPAIPSGYRPGALAVVHPAPPSSAPLVMPSDAVGGFVFGGGTLRLDDLAGRGVAYRGLAGVELQGWLRVREDGRHQVAVDFGSPRAGTLIYTLSCGAALWLEDRQVGQRAGELSLSRGAAPVLSLVLGAELRPGLYRMRLWAACGNLGTPAPVPTTLDVLLKTPSELNLRGITADDLLHRQG